MASWEDYYNSASNSIITDYQNQLRKQQSIADQRQNEYNTYNAQTNQYQAEYDSYAKTLKNYGDIYKKERSENGTNEAFDMAKNAKEQAQRFATKMETYSAGYRVKLGGFATSESFKQRQIQEGQQQNYSTFQRYEQGIEQSQKNYEQHLSDAQKYAQKYIEGQNQKMQNYQTEWTNRLNKVNDFRRIMKEAQQAVVEIQDKLNSERRAEASRRVSWDTKQKILQSRIELAQMEAQMKRQLAEINARGKIDWDWINKKQEEINRSMALLIIQHREPEYWKKL